MEQQQGLSVASRLENLRYQLQDMLDEIQYLLRRTPEWDTASSYWFAHMQGAIGVERSISFVTMMDTIVQIADREMEEMTVREMEMADI